MNWSVDSIFGSTADSRTAALARIPAEVLALLNEKGLGADLSAKEGKLFTELMEIVREHFNADGDALPMAMEDANQHRVKLMDERSTFVRASGREWQANTYSFCEH